MAGVAGGQSTRSFVVAPQSSLTLACAAEPPASLPDAPAPVSAIAAQTVATESTSAAQDTQAVRAPSRLFPAQALRTQKYIEAGEIAPPLTVADKILIGVRDAFSPANIAVWPLAAGYDQAFGSSPNWPRNKAGYFRRAGAVAALDTSTTIFGDSIFSPIFHEDPRFYKVGPGHNVLYRAVYAASRPLVTRTDGGHQAPNVSLLTGTVFGVWLTNAYYPTINQGFDETAKTFGESVGSTSLGFLFVEFADDLLQFVHLKHAQ